MRKFRIKEYKSVEILLFVKKNTVFSERQKALRGNFPLGLSWFVIYVSGRGGGKSAGCNPRRALRECYSEIAFAGVTFARIASIPKIKSFASAQGLFSGIFSMAKE